MKEICAGYNESGQRLDKLLRKALPNANDSFIYKMLRKKNITLNDKKATGSESVKEGDVIRIWFSDETYGKFAGETAEGGGVDGGSGYDSAGAVADEGAGWNRAEKNSSQGVRSAASEESCEKRISKKNSDHGVIKNRRSAQERFDLQYAFDDAVIYEDRDILVINKPAGLLSQKAAQDDISVVELLINNLLSRGEITREQLKTFHPSICNRLDRNTSGVLVCGKSLRGLQDMSELIRGRSVKKDYLAVACGEVREGQNIKAYLIKDHAGNKVRIVEYPQNTAKLEAKGSKPVNTGKKKIDEYHTGRQDAEFIDTEFRPVYTDGGHSLIMVRIHTGKTHQIRAQMAALGHPLCGDVKYGGAKAESGRFPRQLLHAYSLALPDGRRFIAPVPEDIKAAVGGYEWGHGRPADFEDLPLKI